METITRTDEKREICGWQTETFAIDYCSYEDGGQQKSKMVHPHTVLLFVPGNPGCAGWYIQFLQNLVLKMGVGYAARAISYAGHGAEDGLVKVPSPPSSPVNVPRSASSSSTSSGGSDKWTQKKLEDVAWTMHGQMRHKIEWIDQLMLEFITRQKEEEVIMPLSKDAFGSTHSDDQEEDCGNSKSDEARHKSNVIMPKFVFIAHSIGSQLVQRMCILRPDIMYQTKAILYLTPFTRFDARPKWKNSLLSTLGHAPPDPTVAFARFCSTAASYMPTKMMDALLEHNSGISLLEDRELARGLIVNPNYVQNFLKLGSDELRNLPEVHDIGAIKIIAKFGGVPMYILYCGGDEVGEDQWAPRFHMTELQRDVDAGMLPKEMVTLEHLEKSVHDFIVRPHLHSPVMDFACRSIADANMKVKAIASERRVGMVQLRSKM